MVAFLPSIYKAQGSISSTSKNGRCLLQLEYKCPLVTIAEPCFSFFLFILQEKWVHSSSVSEIKNWHIGPITSCSSPSHITLKLQYRSQFPAIRYKPFYYIDPFGVKQELCNSSHDKEIQTQSRDTIESRIHSDTQVILTPWIYTLLDLPSLESPPHRAKAM